MPVAQEVAPQVAPHRKKGEREEPMHWEIQKMRMRPPPADWTRNVTQFLILAPALGYGRFPETRPSERDAELPPAQVSSHGWDTGTTVSDRRWPVICGADAAAHRRW